MVWIGWSAISGLCHRSFIEEYLTFTTEEREKLEVQHKAEELGGNYELAIKQVAESKKTIII